METLISVIVPVYNTERYLAQCIESILNQDLKEIELILIDDGSTDRSGELCDVYAEKDHRVKVFHQIHQGPIAARRKGLLESVSSYVTFVDGDDFIDPVSYSMAVASIKNHMDVIIFGITRYYDINNQKLEKSKYKEGIYQRDEIEENIWKDMIWDIDSQKFGIDPALWNKVMKKELVMSCYQKLKRIDFHYGEDVAIIYPLIRKAHTLEIKSESYYYHRVSLKTVPGYYIDPKYFDKVYLLYQCLMEQLGSETIFVKQIEHFYMCAVGYRKQAYGNPGDTSRYLFPFDKVEKGMKIVLYGAGGVGHTYIDQLKKINYCTVVLWIDKYYEKYISDHVCAVEQIQTVVYDKVVIAIESLDICNVMRDTLINFGVEKDKIVY